MNKQEIYDFLNSRNIPFEISEHGAVYNMEEVAELKLPHPECDAKNLFVRDDKRKQYYLITVKGDKRVNLKQFKKDHGTKALTFASEDELFSKLGIHAGAVTPLALLNEAVPDTEIYLDEYFIGTKRIGVHPNDNTATIWIGTEDLLSLIREHGNNVHVVTM